jgi:hypothetical protein
MQKTAIKANGTRIRNPLLGREPQLAERLATFAILVNDMLLDRLAAKAIANHSFLAEQSQHSFEDVHATAQVLRVLTKSEWDESDLRLFDAFWRSAAFFEPFCRGF